ncbi:MAG: hypothetical protein K2K45_10125 [Muribaculaceae bacterium]|nr:hypothetical protein [Muribaculaceae bacterium]
MNYIAQKYYRSGDKAWLLMVSVMLIVLVSCGNKTAPAGIESVMPEESQFHADNDIAMTVCSLVDAVRVGEALDSIDYNFDGILTDGQGTPLYTDIEGNPGEWKVRVVSGEEAQISNLYLGDLMTHDLRNYIIGALNLNSADLATAYVNPNDEHEFIWLYDLGDAKVSFSETETKTETGLEGIIMKISVFRK